MSDHSIAQDINTSPTKNSIFSPNYTQIPNIIFDYWMEVLTPGEFKVLLCICRKIFGWHKIKDKISANQIVEMTGLSKHGIRKTLENLIKHGLITKSKSKTAVGDDAPNEFSINVIEETKKTGGRQLSYPGVGNSVTQGVGNSVTPQKKDSTKESFTKESMGDAPKTPHSAAPAPKPTKRKTIKEDTIERADEVFTTPKQHGALIKKLKEEKRVLRCYELLSEWKIGKGMTGGSDYRCIVNWVINKLEQQEKAPIAKPTFQQKSPFKPKSKMPYARSSRGRGEKTKYFDTNGKEVDINGQPLI